MYHGHLQLNIVFLHGVVLELLQIIFAMCFFLSPTVKHFYYFYFDPQKYDPTEQNCHKIILHKNLLLVLHETQSCVACFNHF